MEEVDNIIIQSLRNVGWYLFSVLDNLIFYLFYDFITVK